MSTRCYFCKIISLISLILHSLISFILPPIHSNIPHSFLHHHSKLPTLRFPEKIEAIIQESLSFQSPNLHKIHPSSPSLITWKKETFCKRPNHLQLESHLSCLFKYFDSVLFFFSNTTSLRYIAYIP